MSRRLGLPIIEVSGLALAIVLGWATVATGGGDPARALRFPSDANVALAILGGSVLAFYAFQGFETSANVAEEAVDPRRTYPRALLSALAVAGVVYLLIGLALAMVVPAEVLASSSAPLLEIIQAAPVAFPPWLFALIALLAVSNGALLFSIAASRLLYGMAREICCRRCSVSCCPPGGLRRSRSRSPPCSPRRSSPPGT